MIHGGREMSQLTRGQSRRVMYVENKNCGIGNAPARIGWVTFSKTGRTVYYREKVLKRIKGGGIAGNFYDDQTGEEYWVSGIKRSGRDAHWAESVRVEVDEDAMEEYQRLRALRPA